MSERWWLLKSEPHDYAWRDLASDGGTAWDGVRAPGALKNMSRMRPGDMALIYHTGSQRAVVGVARVTSKPYPDPDSDNPRHLVVDLEPVRPLAAPVSLARIKQSGRFPDWDLVRLPRLSVLEVESQHLEAILSWSEAPG